MQWLVRDQVSESVAGTLMVQAVRAAVFPIPAASVAQSSELAAVDIEKDILWEIADTAPDGFYGWIAGESAAVMSLRKYLIKDCGLPRESLNLMGYWRHNKAAN